MAADRADRKFLIDSNLPFSLAEYRAAAFRTIIPLTALQPQQPSANDRDQRSHRLCRHDRLFRAR